MSSRSAAIGTRCMAHFDRHLDEAHKVWLRMPFDGYQWAIDDETQDYGSQNQDGPAVRTEACLQ